MLDLLILQEICHIQPAKYVTNVYHKEIVMWCGGYGVSASCTLVIMLMRWACIFLAPRGLKLDKLNICRTCIFYIVYVSTKWNCASVFVGVCNLISGQNFYAWEKYAYAYLVLVCNPNRKIICRSGGKW